MLFIFFHQPFGLRSLFRSSAQTSNLCISFINDVTFILDTSHLVAVGLGPVCSNAHYYYLVWESFELSFSDLLSDLGIVQIIVLAILPELSLLKFE